MKQLINSIKKHWLNLTLFLLSAITVLSLPPLPELPPVAIKKPKNWLIITLFFIGWSGAIELIQPMVNRYGELLDLIANIGGLVCGWLLGSLILWLGSRGVEN